MTEQPKTPRIQSDDMHPGAGGPFQNHHEARTTKPLHLVACGEAFTNLRDRLLPGDQISICQYDKADYRTARLVAFCKVRVVQKDAFSVEITPPFEVFSVPTADPKPKAEAEPEIVFSDGSWQAAHTGFGKWHVEDGAGEKLAKGLTKDGAEKIAKGHGVGLERDADGSYEIHDPEGLLRDEAA